MRTIIIDDEPKARKTIIDILKFSGEKVEIVAEAENVKSGVEAILKHQPDLVLLDINMPDGSGFDLLKKLPDIRFKLIFITAFENFAIKAFDFSAIDYILKPIDPMKLISSVKRAQELVEKENLSLKLNALFSNIGLQNRKFQKLVLNTENKVHVVDTKDIVRGESDSGYTTFNMINGKSITVSRNLKQFEELLVDVDFLRPHQSHLVNLNYIDYYNKSSGGYIVMKDGAQIPISQRKKEQFLTILANF